MPCARRTIAASCIDDNGAAAQMDRKFAAQSVGPEPIHFAIRQCPSSGDTEGNVGIGSWQWANFYTIALNVDACLTQQVLEDKVGARSAAMRQL
jgi:hypothetical protein